MVDGSVPTSAACKPYAKDRVVLPNARTKSRPKRSPKPVLMKARAKNVATTMSQMTSFVSAPRPCWNVRVRVVTVKVSAMNAQAPTGAGLMTRPGAKGPPPPSPTSPIYFCANHACTGVNKQHAKTANHS